MKVFVQVFCAVLIFKLVTTGSPGEVLQLHYPDVTISAQEKGNLTGQSGRNGDIYISPHNGTVYFEGNDLSEIIQMTKSLPPVWKLHSHVGFSGTFEGGSKVDIPLEVLVHDPENEGIRFELVAGDFPPGIGFNTSSGRLTGIAPDMDAIFQFTIRATDKRDKFADAVFKIETLEADQCEHHPCENGGQCHNTNVSYGYHCTCVGYYGGHNCHTDCRENALGISSQKSIPDAQMSAFLTHGQGDTYASHARLDMHNGKAWCGENANSWLQVDLGREARLFTIASEGLNQTSNTKSFKLSYSTNGMSFNDVLNTTSNATSFHTFTGYTSTNMETIPGNITARFIRLHPLSYVTGHQPCIRIELYGCWV